VGKTNGRSANRHLVIVDIHAASRRDRKRATKTLAFLNGRELRWCFFADTRRGIARVFKEVGGYVPMTPDGEPRTEELRGQVRVRTRRVVMPRQTRRRF
jgi:hypothetical protein